MENTVKEKFALLVPITRVEFIPANSASILIGFAWAIDNNYIFDLKTIGLLLSLFVVLSAVGTLGAHWNSYSDYELDADDPTKTILHKSLSDLGKKKLKDIIRVEFLLAVVIFLLFLFNHFSWKLLGLWVTATSLAFAYSKPPARFKAKGPLAFIVLCLVLSILPIMFVYLSINQSLNAGFIWFLLGHTMVIYSLIVPTEIRDYVVDKSHQVSTMTIWLGLKKAIVFSQSLMVIGTLLIVASYSKQDIFKEYAILYISLFLLIACNGFVFFRQNHLRKLIYASSNNDHHTKKICEFAKDNPKWITISSIGSMVAAFIVIIGKI